jgi:hypothetical protein
VIIVAILQSSVPTRIRAQFCSVKFARQQIEGVCPIFGGRAPNRTSSNKLAGITRKTALNVYYYCVLVYAFHVYIYTCILRCFGILRREHTFVNTNLLNLPTSPQGRPSFCLS